MKLTALAAIAGFTTIAAAGLAATAHATDSGNDLFAKCADTNSFYNGYCLGYVVAAVDAWDADIGICLPDGVTKGQIKDVVIKYLVDHPDRRHYVAASNVNAALWTAFPCPTKPKVTS